MAAAEDTAPVVVLPERFDRRLRLGPFHSAREAVEFLTFGATGAVLAAITTPVLGIGLAAGGFVLAVARIDGEGLDRRAFAWIRFVLSDRRGGGNLRRSTSRPLASGGLMRVGARRYCGVVRAAGMPTAYLPPSDLARRFETFQELLRSLDGPLLLRSSLAPMPSAPVLPDAPSLGRRDGPAIDGYRELVRLLCRRRRVRRVDLFVSSTREGSDGVIDVEARARTLIERLEALGVPARRLRGRALEDAVASEGWGCGLRPT